MLLSKCASVSQCMHTGAVCAHSYTLWISHTVKPSARSCNLLQLVTINTRRHSHMQKNTHGGLCPISNQKMRSHSGPR